MAKYNYRIKIPKNPAELIKLAKKIFAKHEADGDKSPLKLMKKYSWEEVGPELIQCSEYQDQVESLEKQLEELYRKRDALLVQVDGAVKGSRDTLLGLNRDDPKSLGEYGFTVDDTPRPPKKPKGE